jgi:hypothetical protein
MPQISKQKRDKISEQILEYLFAVSPEAQYTNKIASEIVRDEEFTKAILLELEKAKLVVSIDKNPKGNNYSRRLRWRLSPQAYAVYKQHQQVLNKKTLSQSSTALIDESI